MIQGILSAAHIQGVAVRQEGLSSQLLHHIRHHFGIVGAKVGQIAGLSKVNLDGHKVILKVNLVNACRLNQPSQLVRQGLPVSGAHVSKVNL